MLFYQRIKDEIKFGKIQMQLETVNAMVQKIAEKVDVNLSSFERQAQYIGNHS